MISIYHPFSFTFLWATISTVISYYSGAMESVSDLMGLKGADLGKYEKNATISNYSTLIILAIIPVLSFSSWVFTAKKATTISNI